MNEQETPIVSLLRVLLITHPAGLVTLNVPSGDDSYDFRGRLIAVSDCGRVVQLMEDDGEVISISTNTILFVRHTPAGAASVSRMNLEGALIEVDLTQERLVKEVRVTAKSKRK